MQLFDIKKHPEILKADCINKTEAINRNIEDRNIEKNKDEKCRIEQSFDKIKTS